MRLPCGAIGHVEKTRLTIVLVVDYNNSSKRNDFSCEHHPS
jgi:hypothetical protein